MRSGESRRALGEELLHAGRDLEGQALETPARHLHTELARAAALHGDVAGRTVAWRGLPASMVVAAVAASWLGDAVPLVVPHDADHLTEHALLVMTRRPDGVLDASPGGGDQEDDEDDPTAVLQPTSGSTGLPVVARRSVLSVRTEASRYAAAIGLAAHHRVVVGVPVTHSYGLGWALSALLLGARVAVPDVVLPHRLLRLVESRRATHLALSAPVAGRVAALPGRPARASLESAMVGGGVVATELEAAFRTRMGIGLGRNYGSSQTGPTFFGDPGLPPGLLGRPGAGVRILAPRAGASGELVLALTERGPQAARTWTHATGDLVTRGTDGSVLYGGRVDGRVRLNGRFLDVGTVAALLRRMPGVHDVAFAVTASRAGVGAEELTVVVAGDDVDARRVRAAVVAARGPELGAVGLALLPRIPLDERGKLDRAAAVDARQEMC